MDRGGLRETCVRQVRRWLSRPLPHAGPALALVVVVASLWLFRDGLLTYRLHSDDFAYVGDSRSAERMLGNLFTPHNTHIVPAWRVWTFLMVALSGGLVHLPTLLAAASFGSLVLAMLLARALVARETGSAALGLAAMIVVGTSSLVARGAVWYSASQATWAGIGCLGMLCALQSWRWRPGVWSLVGAFFSIWLAGGMWTVGHVAGPVGAVYVWADGRPRCRRLAVVVVGFAIASAGVSLALGWRRMDATVSFHGRTSTEAVDPVMGVSHSCQAIVEQLGFGNLGLTAETTPIQAAVLCALATAIWVAARSVTRVGTGVSRSGSRLVPLLTVALALLLGLGWMAVRRQPLALDMVLPLAGFGMLAALTITSPAWRLERAGAALALGSAMLEWSFRGYLPYSSLRRIVPWYDIIPQIGFVLFILGGTRTATDDADTGTEAGPLTAGSAIALSTLLTAMVILHRPAVDLWFKQYAYGPIPVAQNESRPENLPIERARELARAHAQRQRGDLARLDRAEATAGAMGIGRDDISQTFGRVAISELPIVYDAVPMLDLPAHGRPFFPAEIQDALGRDLSSERPGPAQSAK